MKKLVLSLFFLSILIIPSYVFADGPYLNIPPTNAFDKVHSDNGTISAQNFSMPVNIKGGQGIQVKSNNATHTLQISSTISQASGTYNTTQANNVNINTGGSKINFINGTGATVHLQNSGAGNQVNVTVSATGVASGVSSLNALTGALTIACVSGNTTCTTSGGNTITVNTAYNVVVTGGSAQTISKLITSTGGFTMSNANINLGTGNNMSFTNYNFLQPSAGISFGNGMLFIPKGLATPLFGIAPFGSNHLAALQVFRNSTFVTNYESIAVGSDFNTSPEFVIAENHGGTGHARPINVYENNNQKLLSFDVANTITNYVNTLFKAKITQYNSINTAGWGVPAIYGSGRLTGLTGASGTVTSYTVGGSDGTFEVSGDILATTSTNYNFQYNVAWTDETGTLRTTGMIFTGQGISGVTGLLTNVNGPDFQGLPMTIHAKAGTTITLGTSGGGTYTTVTYNIDGIIKQVA